MPLKRNAPMPMLRTLLTIVLLVTSALATPVLATAQQRTRITTANAAGIPTWNRDAEFRAALPSPQP